jgi:hypothetical protein
VTADIPASISKLFYALLAADGAPRLPINSLDAIVDVLAIGRTFQVKNCSLPFFDHFCARPSIP